MNAKLSATLIVGLVVILGSISSAATAADEKASKLTFTENVSQVFRSRCGTCHNGDKQKGGLNLETYSAAMQGGGSGKVIEPGDPDGSTLLQLVMHKDEPKMPPNSPKIPDAEIELLKKWIEGGALESSGSVAAVKPKAKFEFKLDPSSMGKPAGPPAMPEKLPTEPIVVSQKAPAVVAMATSPWAPLVAVGGHKQVLLYRTTDTHLVGVLPFPEGTVYALRFSRSGALLLAGGGRGGQSGLAVAWDVKTGKRVFEVGKEYDVVLAADISPDHGQVALGGPGKIVRVYNTADGQLAFEMKKHTEWVTALEFSPDGVLLASGDRSNGLVVWEAGTGREFYDLRGHNAAITDVSWRLDSNVLASSSEDGSVRLWEMENGSQIKAWGAHGGGVESVRFAKDGRLATTGRDRVTRLWDQNGAKQRDFEAFGDLALEAVFSHDDARLIAADWTGEVRVFEPKDGKRLANLVANPATIAGRLDAARKAVNSAQEASIAAAKALAPALAVASEKAALADKVGKTFAEATGKVTQSRAAADAVDKALQAKSAEEKVALDARKAAEAALARATDEKVAAEKAVPAKAAEESAASAALATAKEAVIKALAIKNEHDKALVAAVESLKGATSKDAAEKRSAALAQQVLRATELTAAVGIAGSRQAMAQAGFEQAVLDKAAAPVVLQNAVAKASAAEQAVKTSQSRATGLAAEKATLAKSLADARASQKALETAAAAIKTQLDQALAASTAAAKLAGAAKQTADAAVAALNAAKAEVELLAVEKQQLDATRSASATTASKGS